MIRLGDIAARVRAKNAGPFWLTVDIFCASQADFERLRGGLDTAAVARAFRTAPERILRFEMPDLKAIKLSLPRPSVQGARADRDMHGAAFARVLEELEIP